jgi:hypothetical protein
MAVVVIVLGIMVEINGLGDLWITDLLIIEGNGLCYSLQGKGGYVLLGSYHLTEILYRFLAGTVKR